jgi:hypothetical protein
MSRVGLWASSGAQRQPVWAAVLLLASVVAAPALCAQDPAAAAQSQPQDARSLLSYHLEAAPRAEAQLAALATSGLSPEARSEAVAELRWQAYVYLQAGAEGELLPLLDGLAKVEQVEPGVDLPADLHDATLADAERFRIQAACWSPDQYSAGLDLATAWAGRHPKASEAESNSVAAMKEYLESRLQDREEIQSRAASLLWYPLLSLLLLLGLGRLLWRQWFS